jgi:hypothetical protein
MPLRGNAAIQTQGIVLDHSQSAQLVLELAAQVDSGAGTGANINDMVNQLAWISDDSMPTQMDVDEEGVAELEGAQVPTPQQLASPRATATTPAASGQGGAAHKALLSAATKLAARYRGQLVRKQLAKEHQAATKLQAMNRGRVAREKGRLMQAKSVGAKLVNASVNKQAQHLVGSWQRFKDAAREEHQIANLIWPPENDESLTPAQVVHIFFLVLTFE